MSGIDQVTLLFDLVQNGCNTRTALRIISDIKNNRPVDIIIQKTEVTIRAD